ncbi:hypothetical protein WMF30_32270 [Sorangium sp. So ce134]
MISFTGKAVRFAMILAALTPGCSIDAVDTDDADPDQAAVDETYAETPASAADARDRDERGALVASGQGELSSSKGYVGQSSVQQARPGQQAPRKPIAVIPGAAPPRKAAGLMGTVGLGGFTPGCPPCP